MKRDGRFSGKLGKRSFCIKYSFEVFAICTLEILQDAKYIVRIIAMFLECNALQVHYDWDNLSKREEIFLLDRILRS